MTNDNQWIYFHLKNVGFVFFYRYIWFVVKNHRFWDINRQRKNIIIHITAYVSYNYKSQFVHLIINQTKTQMTTNVFVKKQKYQRICTYMSVESPSAILNKYVKILGHLSQSGFPRVKYYKYRAAYDDEKQSLNMIG